MALTTALSSRNLMTYTDQQIVRNQSFLKLRLQLSTKNLADKSPSLPKKDLSAVVEERQRTIVKVEDPSKMKVFNRGSQVEQVDEVSDSCLSDSD